MKSFRLAVPIVVALVALATPPSRADAPRPLSSRGTENLTAFARLLSLVRFFHPSDGAAGADWNRVAVAGVDAVEGAADAPALAQALESYFRPIAPTLRVYPAGQRPEIPAELRAPAPADLKNGLKIVAWRHFGGGVSGDKEVKIFVSERIDNRLPPRTGSLFQGIKLQGIKPGRLQGRRVRLRAAVRAEVEPGGFAQLGLRVYRAGTQVSFSDDMADRPIRDASWRIYEIEGDVAPDAEQIIVLLALTGGGKVWFDDVSLEPVDGGPGEPFLNGGFEEGEPGRQPPHWYFPYESVQAGYHPVVRRGEACRSGGCLEIGSDEIATPRIPRPDEVLEADLGGGVTAVVPLSLWADKAGTLPHTEPGAPGARALPWAGVDPGGDTRASHLASVALLWGIQQHFHPHLDPTRPEWIEALPAALQGVAQAADREAFRRELERLLVPLGDGQAFVDHPDESYGALPLAWAWVEDRLVVTGASPEAGGLRVGDVITAIDGRPVAGLLADAEAQVSAPRPEIRRGRAASSLIWGTAGGSVQLEVLRPGSPGSPPLRVTLTRGTAERVRDTPLPAVAEPRPGVFYVDLRRTSEDELSKLMPKLAAARGVVFDLRGYVIPGVSTFLLSHLADRTVESLSSQVPVVMRPDHRNVLWLTTFLKVQPAKPRLSRVALVINGRTHGNSELLLGVVERYGWAQIVGEPSAGSNGTVNWTTLPGGYEASWTGRRVLKHDGSPWHGARAKPTVPVSRTIKGIAEGRDEVVERAVELLAGRP